MTLWIDDFLEVRCPHCRRWHPVGWLANGTHRTSGTPIDRRLWRGARTVQAARDRRPRVTEVIALLFVLHGARSSAIVVAVDRCRNVASLRSAPPCSSSDGESRRVSCLSVCSQTGCHRRQRGHRTTDESSFDGVIAGIDQSSATLVTYAVTVLESLFADECGRSPRSTRAPRLPQRRSCRQSCQSRAIRMDCDHHAEAQRQIEI
jgi:hypothetical protein